MCTRCDSRPNTPIEEVGAARAELTRPDRNVTITLAAGDRAPVRMMHAELVGFPDARSTDHRSLQLVDLPVG